MPPVVDAISSKVADNGPNIDRILKKSTCDLGSNCLNKKVTEGVHREGTLPQIIGNRTNGGLSTQVGKLL